MSPLSIVTAPWSYLPFTSKGQSGIFDNDKIDQSIHHTLRALDEDCRGAPEVALDVYFEALSCMIDALPASQDAKRNKLIQHKFATLLARKCDIRSCSPKMRRPRSECSLTYADITPVEGYDTLKVTEIEPEPVPPKATLSEKVVQAAVAGAVALKQSPIPDAICSTFSFTLQKAQAIDKYIGVQSLCWEVSKVGINKAIELDAQYNLHEKVSTAIMTSATAVIKAGIAYKEASSYQDVRANVLSQT